MDTFFSLTKSNTPLVSVDSLRKLAGGFFRSISFNPNLTSYNEAVASGNLSLLQNKALLEEFTLFNRAYDDFRKFEEAGFYSFYSGSSWELRKTAKPGLLYGREPAGEISYVEYKKLISSNLAQNCFENSHNLARNTRRRLLKCWKSLRPSSKCLKNANSMIKIFRQIRQTLVISGNSVKYLKYAIGEIILVVIGILIALQINTWNENRKDRISEAIYYCKFLEDVDQDQAILLTQIQKS
ncbi:MAG: hypothetical protein IPL55_03425 [Saprospiraceae bacterium]|nr:hypothetical protein [Saprospiraceae bacterium]